MSLTRYVVLAAAVGLAATTNVRGGDKPPARDDGPIKEIVGHFAEHGVKLEKDKTGWWVVVDPKAEGYEVTVVLRAFPAGATEKEMRDEVQRTNVALVLNTPARLAMSRPGLRITDPTKKPPKDVPVAAKLEKLFKEYRPPEPKE